MSGSESSSSESVDDELPEVAWVHYLWPDGSPLDMAKLVAVGQHSLVIRHSPTIAWKVPVKALVGYSDGSERMDEDAERASAHMHKCEIAAYSRLRGQPGIVAYHGLVAGGCIAMDYHPAGSLDRLVMDGEHASLESRLKWMLETIHIVHTCHQARVLLFDIALRNFVVAGDQSLRGIDFAQAAVLPIDADIDSANEDGLTVRIDIFYLGCVLYSLATWSKFDIDCGYEKAGQDIWPSAEALPSLTEVPWGRFINKCWTKQYTNVAQLLDDCDEHTDASG